MPLYDDGLTFALPPNATRTLVRYRNRYGIELSADLYTPMTLDQHTTHPGGHRPRMEG